jgi:hypothetical protein
MFYNIGQSPQSNKNFFGRNSHLQSKLVCFSIGKHLQPSLIFASEERACYSGAFSCLIQSARLGLEH